MEAKKKTIKLVAALAVLLTLTAYPARVGAQAGANPDSTATEEASVKAAAAETVMDNGKTPSEMFGLGMSHTLYIKVQVPDSKTIRKLKRGDTIEGGLTQAVYSGSQKLFPEASRITLTVGEIKRCRRPYNDHWPWVAAVFMPRHENCPTIEAARVSLADGREAPLSVSLISLARERQVQAKARKKQLSRVPATAADQDPAASDAGLESAKSFTAGTATRKKKTPELTFTLAGAELAANGTEGSARDSAPPTSDPANPLVLPAGTPAKVILLGSLSASKSHAGDLFRARLVEPVRVGTAVVLPEGSILEGHVVKAVRPRTLSRPGSLLFTFDRFLMPEAPPTAVSASVTAARLDRFSQTNIDPEGVMRGTQPGKLWLLINLGATGGIAKVVDDTEQLIVEAIVSTATDASTAGTARIVASCTSGLFMLTRHGRDVVLPQLTELDIAFNRSVTVPLPPANLATSTPSIPEAQK